MELEIPPELSRCPSGKVRFKKRPSRRELRERFRKDGRQNRRIYQCHLCGDFHITTMSPQENRQARKRKREQGRLKNDGT